MMMNSLRASGLFNGLSDEQLHLLTPSAHMVTVPEHQFLFTAGQAAEHLYVIVEGQISLEMTFPKTVISPLSIVTLCTLGPPQVVGFRAFIEPYIYAFSTRAVRRVCCVSIDADRLRQAMADDIQMGYTLMQNAAELLVVRLDRVREALGHQSRVLGSLFTR